MHKSFLITEEDRNRILGMHQSATKRQYLSEQKESYSTWIDACLKKSGGKLNSDGNYVLRFEGKRCEFFPNGTYVKINKPEEIHYYDYVKQQMRQKSSYLSSLSPVRILITSGASCPDALVERVIRKLAGFYQKEEQLEKVFAQFKS